MDRDGTLLTSPDEIQKRLSRGPRVYLTRIEHFSACHRLHSKHLSDEENKQVFGKCNWANGHGHNYKLEITLYGEVDRQTGMVMNLTELKSIVQRHVLDVLDHRNLDLDVPYFESRVSSVENIAIFVWEQILRNLPDPALLHEVKVHETEKNIAVYRGDY